MSLILEVFSFSIMKRSVCGIFGNLYNLQIICLRGSLLFSKIENALFAVFTFK